MANTNSTIFSWIVENLQECKESEYVDLLEIKKKCGFEVTSSAVGNSMKKIFKNIKIKAGRSKDNWCKTTQRYYGVQWKDNKNENPEIDFTDIPTFIPPDYFVIMKTPVSVKIGHFTGEIINGTKVLIEIQLQIGGIVSLLVKGKQIDLEKIGLQNTFLFTANSVKLLFQLLNQLRYCTGVDTVQQNVPHFQEQICCAGDENSEQIRYRAKTCSQVLPLKISNAASPFCRYCKKLKTNVQLNAKQSETTDIENTNKSENEVTLCESDHSDLSDILNTIFPDCPIKMQTFLLNQKMALERNPFGRRWDKGIIRLCLTLYCRSPRGYSELRDSNFVILPSQNLLRRYKNAILQEAGINKEMLKWMASEADMKGIPPEGYQGGLIIDEMSIQQDLQFRKRKGTIELIGFTECTPESLFFDEIKSNKKERTLATHVLQFMFLGFTGFRFPFAHFPSHTASGHELYLLVWKAVNLLLTVNFTIQYISTDGAQSNRDLFKILLPDFNSANPVTCSFRNVFAPSYSLFFIMDISHTIKKIRNNISKSGELATCKRRLKFKDRFIEWNHFKQAYLWDISNNPFPVHHKLSQEHMFLTSENKMRNHLAEDVLNSDMLHLMQLYKDSLGEAGDKLDGTIELLENTSVLIQNFKDIRPITDITDDRLKQNQMAIQYIKIYDSWSSHVL